MNSVMATNQTIGDVAQTHIVFDRYFKISLKAQTQYDRGSVEGGDHHITLETKVPTDKK